MTNFAPSATEKKRDRVSLSRLIAATRKGETRAGLELDRDEGGRKVLRRAALLHQSSLLFVSQLQIGPISLSLPTIATACR